MILNKFAFPIQFITAIIISTFIDSTELKTLILLFFFGTTFWPWTRKEIFYFFLTSLVFTLSNYGALWNQSFVFTQKDVLLMPYNELLMWGFYCLNAKRFVQENNKNKVHKKSLIFYSIIFASTFSVIKDEVILMLLSLILLVFGYFIFKERKALLYVLYFLLMGIVVEFFGVYYGLWHYPSATYFHLPLWAPLMWIHIGLIMSQISSWFFEEE